jgi:hypothetical protein
MRVTETMTEVVSHIPLGECSLSNFPHQQSCQKTIQRLGKGAHESDYSFTCACGVTYAIEAVSIS